LTAAVGAVTLQQLAPKTPTYHRIVRVKDVPETVTEVREPADSHTIQLNDRRL